VAADVRRSLREFRSFYARLRGQLRQLPVDDVAALNRRLQSIGSSLQRQNAAFAKSFDTLSSRDAFPELQRAVKNSPACAGL
jgi:hypothetical protein